jgi:two-component system, LytTR family, sensor kinase
MLFLVTSLRRAGISFFMSLFWVAVAAVVFVQATVVMELKGEPNEWFISLIVSLGWIGWAVLSPFIVKAIAPVRMEKGALAKPLLIYFAWSFVFVSLQVLYEFGLFNVFLRKEGTLVRMPDYVLYQLHTRFLLFFFIVFIIKAVEFYERYHASRVQAEKLNAELSNARLGALKMQLNPHFLFNTHHSIISLMLQNENKKAISMLMKLSDFLRTTLDNNNQLSSLSDEIRLMKFYLDIQQIRFGDKLTVRIDVDQAAENAAVPSFILQPIIENAIIHGIAPVSSPAMLMVNCVKVNGTLEIEVSDNGKGVKSAKVQEGIGLKNTRSRLEELYNCKAGLQIKPHPVRGTITRIWMPFTEYNQVAYAKDQINHR